MTSTDALPDGEIWRMVDDLIDRAPSLADLRAHRLQLLAARRWREVGRPVPPDLLFEEQIAAVKTLATQEAAKQVRGVTDGTLLVLKGPDVASRYPDRALRTFRDLDFLVSNPQETQRALVAAGFEPIGDPVIYEFDVHHLRPLLCPAIPLVVEVHKRPNIPRWMTPPTTAELLSVAIPSSLGLDGVVTLPPAYHAVLLAAHSWARSPLRRLRDLLDVVLMSDGEDRAEIEAIARRWGCESMWKATIAAADAVFHDRSTPFSMHLWARNLKPVRDRTVLENHLQRWVSSFWVLPLGRALRASAGAIANELRPAWGESWHRKLVRIVKAIRNAVRGATEHESALGPDARRRRLRGRSEGESE